MSGGDEKQLLAALMVVEKEWRKISPTGHPSVRIQQMIGAHGPAGMAKRVVRGDLKWEGFTTIFLEKRFDLTVEWVVLREQFKTLFDDEDRRLARKRLTDLGCTDFGVDAASI